MMESPSPFVNMSGSFHAPTWSRSLGIGGLFVCAASSASAAVFEQMTEQQYERLFSAPAIIYGLALAKLVGELGDITRAPKTVAKSLSQIIWIHVLILFILILFFAGSKYIPPLNHFGVFLSTIGLALLLYLAADALVVPSSRQLSETVNYRTEFQARSRYFVFYAMIALLWMSARDSLLFLNDLKEAARVAQENSLRMGVSLVLLIPLAIPRSWTHVPIGLVALGALLYHIYVTPGFVRPLLLEGGS